MSITQKIKDLTSRLARSRGPETSPRELIEREVADAVSGLVRGTHDGVVNLPAIKAQHPGVTLDALDRAVAESYGRRMGRLTLSQTVLNHPRPGLYQDVRYELRLGAEELHCELRK